MFEMDCGSQSELNELPEDFLEHLVVEYGQRGERAVGHLQTAWRLAALRDDGALVKIGESIAYNLREAMASIADAAGLAPVSDWASLSRGLADAVDFYDSLRDVPGGEAEAALSGMRQAASALRAFHEEPKRRQRQVEFLIVERTGGTPLAAQISPTREFVSVLDRTNTALHELAPNGAPVPLCNSVLEILQRLFMPPEQRLNRLKELASFPGPVSADSIDEVTYLVTTVPVLGSFLSAVQDLTWLDCLGKAGVLDPPADEKKGWAVVVAAEHLGAIDQARFVQWLRSAYAKAETPGGKALVVVAALRLGDAGIPLLLRALKDQGVNQSVSHIAANLALKKPADDPLVRELADLLLNPLLWSAAGFAEMVLAHFITGLDEQNSSERLQILAFKLGAIDLSGSSRIWKELNDRVSLAKWETWDTDAREALILEAFVAGIFKAAQWVSLKELLHPVRKIPSPIGPRLQALILTHAPDLDVEEAIELSAGLIENGRATEDAAGLVDRIVQEVDESLYSERWRDALGSPPAQSEVRDGQGRLKSDVREKAVWASLLPTSISDAWAETLGAIRLEIGEIDREALFFATRVVSDWGRSPIEPEALASLSSRDAAIWVSNWRPADEWSMENARDLGRALEDVVGDQPGGWLGDVLELARVLAQPIFVTHLLKGIARAVRKGLVTSDQVDGILDLIELVQSDPWEPTLVTGETLFDYEPDWSLTKDATLDVIKALASSQVGFNGRGGKAWEVVAATVRDLGPKSTVSGAGVEPLISAVNRSSGIALRTLLVLLWHERQLGSNPPQVALDTLDFVVGLDGQDGLELRAVLASEWNFLLQAVPDWLNSRKDSLFGDSAPGDLGQRSVDIALERDSPGTWLFSNYRSKIFDAARRGVQRASEGIMIAMLHGEDGYSTSECVEFARNNPDVGFGRSLGWVLRSDDLKPEWMQRALQFWDQMISRGPASALGEFGTMASCVGLDFDEWASYTLRTLHATEGPLDGAIGEMLDRLSSEAPTPDSLDIANQMVRRESPPWESARVIASANELLTWADALAETDAYARLKTALLERGREQ